MHLITIAESWYKLAKATPEEKQLSLGRLSICDTCPEKMQLSPAGKVVVSTVNKESSLYYCKACGCPLAALTIHPENQCKKNKWGSQTLNSYY